MAVAELFRPYPDVISLPDPEISKEMFPWYLAPDSPLPDPSEVGDISLLPLLPSTKHLLRISQTENAHRRVSGLDTIEIGRTFSLDPTTGIITPEAPILGIHDKVDSDLHLLPQRGVLPMITLHEHTEDDNDILQPMSSHRDHFPGVMEREWGRLSRANLVVSQPDGEQPTFYLSLATTDTPIMSKQQRDAYDTKWEEIRVTAGRERREELEACLEDAYNKVNASWQHGMESGLAVMRHYKERDARGELSANERVIWQSEFSRLQEFNHQANRFAEDPDVVEATRRLQEHIARTDHAIRLAAARDIGVTMLVAKGWDMQFHKVDLAA